MKDCLPNEIFYPAIHKRDEEWGLSVTTSGFQMVEPYSLYPPKGHPRGYNYIYRDGRILDEFQLVYIVKGKGEFVSTSVEEIVIEEGTVFMLFPGEWHTYRPVEAIGWEVYWVGFSGKQAARLMRKNFFNVEKPFFQVGYNEELIRFFQQINENAKREEPGAQALLAGIVVHMLGYLFHFRENEFFVNKPIVPMINKAKVIMRKHLLSDVNPEEIASRLNISYSWFRRAFKEYTGFSPAQFIIQLKIQKAKDMLVQTNNSVKSIAHILDFETTGYFSVFFKRETGMSPLAYRAMCRKSK